MHITNYDEWLAMKSQNEEDERFNQNNSMASLQNLSRLSNDGPARPSAIDAIADQSPHHFQQPLNTAS